MHYLIHTTNILTPRHVSARNSFIASWFTSHWLVLQRPVSVGVEKVSNQLTWIVFSRAQCDAIVLKPEMFTQ